MANSNSDNVTKRSVVDRRLTWGELDTNFEELIRAIDDIEVLESGLNGKVEQTVYTNKMQSLDTINQQQTEDIEDLQQNLISGLSGGAPIYENVSKGLNSTEIDRYFNVPSNDEEESLILYYHDTGDVAVEKKRIPSATAIQNSRKERKLAIRLQESISGRFPDFRSDFKLESYGTRLNDGYFMPAEFDDLVSLSRPSVKYVWDRYGKLVEVPAGQPAFDHDPVTGQPLGLLLEQEATNNIQYSSDFSNYGVANGSITDYIKSPDGSITFAHLVEGTNAGSSFMSITSSYYGGGLAGKKYTFSCFAKSDGSDRQLRLAHNGTVFPASAVFNLVDGTTDDPNYGKIEPQGNGVYRCSVTGVASDDFSSFLMVQIANPQQTGTDGIYVWGLQFEEEELSSYIPTSGSAVTRAADVASAENSFLDNFDSSQGWLFIEYDLASDGFALQIETEGATNNYNSFYIESSSITLFDSDSVAFRSQSDYTGRHKVLLSWRAGVVSAYADGALLFSGEYVVPQWVRALFFRRTNGRTPGNGHLFEFQMGDTISDADAIARTTL